MCVLVFAHKFHPDFKFIFAGNRDEFYSRPAKHASVWGNETKILSGIDLKSNGTWLGITIQRNDSFPNGNFAVVTNFRDFYRFKENPELKSRGKLVKEFLEGNYPYSSIETRFVEFGNYLNSNSNEYNAFNLIYGNFDELYYFTNVENRFEKISTGIHGLSNSFLDVPWPKLHWTKLQFSEIINSSNDLVNDLLQLLLDQTQFDEELLPDTGVGLEREKLLSSIFIKSVNYGTRCSTIILVDNKDNLFFLERNYDGDRYFDVTFSFNLKSTSQDKIF